MAEVNPPTWLQNAGNTHTAAMMRSIIGALLAPAVSAGSLIPAGGVSPHLGNKLVVTQTGSPSMAIIVKSGLALVPGSENSLQGVYGVENDGDLTIAVTSNGSGLARIDSVFFKVQDTQYSGGVNSSSLVVVAGTPSGSPVHPAAPNNAIRLADIAVANGAASIVTANITDTRTWLGTVSGTIKPDEQIFTASGTWTKPDGARWVWIRVQASGGAGGGSNAASASQHSCGGGGGGGGYAEAIVDASTLAATVTVTVGAGGIGAANAAGGNGNTSSFGATVVASGGGGGQIALNSGTPFGQPGGSGGIGSAGDVLIGGGGGTSCWGDTNLATGGAGGSAFMGGGGAGQGTSANAQSLTGNAGRNFGGGGGGAVSTSTGTAAAGGAGAGGIVYVTTFI